LKFLVLASEDLWRYTLSQGGEFGFDPRWRYQKNQWFTAGIATLWKSWGYKGDTNGIFARFL